MSRNTASAPFRPSRRAPRGARAVESPPLCGLPSLGRNVISARKQRGAGRTRLVQRFPRGVGPDLRGAGTNSISLTNDLWRKPVLEQAEAFLTFAYFAMYMAREEADSYPALEHDYTVETEICETSLSWCNLANIACWGRHYHAPRKRGGYGSAVKNGDRSILEGIPFGDDPIRTGVGKKAKLPANAVGNITQEGHVLHNDEMGDWGTCPKKVPDEGSGTPPAECNQVYREPYEEGGKISMRTRGTGENSFDLPNRVFGPWLFEPLDEMMMRAILDKPDHLCPSL